MECRRALKQSLAVGINQAFEDVPAFRDDGGGD